MAKRILFVCTGNTCRSPMAEGLLRGMADREGIPVEVRSAGVSAVDGMPISPHSHSILLSRGMKASITSSALNDQAVQWADLILTMTVSHKRGVIQHFPNAVEKTYTLKEYVDDDPQVLEGIREREALYTDLQMKLALGRQVTDEEKKRLLELERRLPNYDIDDPFGGNPSDYERCAGQIEASLSKLLRRLQK